MRSFGLLNSVISCSKTEFMACNGHALLLQLLTGSAPGCSFTRHCMSSGFSANVTGVLSRAVAWLFSVESGSDPKVEPNMGFPYIPLRYRLLFPWIPPTATLGSNPRALDCWGRLLKPPETFCNAGIQEHIGRPSSQAL